MSLKYEVLKRLVKASGLKKRWVSQSTEELLEGRRRQNAKNHIPELKDDAFTISRIDVMGFPVLKLIHKQGADHANLFLIGGGMIVSAFGLATQKEKKHPAIMLAGSVLCALFAGLCWQGYKKR